MPKLWLDPTDNGASLGSYELLYSQIDMSAKEGLGEVVAKNVIVDQRSFEDQQALNRHANGIDWWLVVPLRDTNQYAVYLIDSSGIERVSFQEIGLEDSWKSRGGGQSVFTPLGDKYLRYSSISGLQIFDFDRTTGQLSNFEFVSMPGPDRAEVGFGGLGISPNSRFAYVSTIFTVYQYDLWADDVPNSRVRVGEVGNPDSIWVGLVPTSYNFQLGPDCKLYNYAGSADKYHIIHAPNEKGRASQWEQGALELPFWFFRDQPYFPHFRLGPLGDESSPCAKDLIVSTGRPLSADPVYLNVYPNPATGPFSLSLSGVLGGQVAEWTLYDGRGRLVRQEQLQPGEVTEISRNGLRAGMYFWRLSVGGGILQSGKVVLVE